MDENGKAVCKCKGKFTGPTCKGNRIVRFWYNPKPVLCSYCIMVTFCLFFSLVEKGLHNVATFWPGKRTGNQFNNNIMTSAVLIL